LKRTLLHALALTACLSAPLAAQDAPARDLRGLGVSAGSRVRLTAPSVSERPLVGRVDALTADSLALARGAGARLQIDTRHVEGLAVSAGRNRWGWAIRGAGLGFLVGGIVGAQAASGDQADFAGLVGLIAGVIVGTPLGAGIGAAAAPERWTPVRLPPPAGG
jgi:hypothetical protein